MKKLNLPIPAMIPGVINIHANQFADWELNSELAIFILGSLVYEDANERGERRLNPFVKNLDRFDLYLEVFLETNLLKAGTDDRFKYGYDVDWERYLEPYCFDSIIVQEILQEEFPNFEKYLENTFKWLEPNLIRKNLPF